MSSTLRSEASLEWSYPVAYASLGVPGTRSLDWLAAQGLSRAEVRFASTLHQRAAVKPLTTPEVDAIVTRANGWIGRSSMWWVNRCGEIILYRGQTEATSRILSPMAREKGIPASKAIEERLRSAGITSEEIALLTAKSHNAPVHPYWAPPGMAGELLGAAGIPTTRLPGVAASFGGDSVVYVIRLQECCDQGAQVGSIGGKRVDRATRDPEGCNRARHPRQQDSSAHRGWLRTAGTGSVRCHSSDGSARSEAEGVRTPPMLPRIPKRRSAQGSCTAMPSETFAPTSGRSPDRIRMRHSGNF
jgi:hypothetical protein